MRGSIGAAYGDAAWRRSSTTSSACSHDNASRGRARRSTGRPTSSGSRCEVEPGPASLSALRWGTGAARARAAARRRAERAHLGHRRARARTARCSRSTSRATATPTGGPTAPYWPAENARVGGDGGRAQVAPDAAAVVGMSLGGLTALALSARGARRSSAGSCSSTSRPGVNRDKASAIANFVDGPESFASFDEILERTVLFNPTRSESSLRRGILHNATARPDGTWSWRYDRFLPEGDESSPRLRRPLGRRRRGRRCRSCSCAAPTPPSSTTRTSPSCAAARPAVRVEVVEGAGHSIQGDQPLELAAAPRRLRRLTRAAPSDADVGAVPVAQPLARHGARTRSTPRPALDGVDRRRRRDRRAPGSPGCGPRTSCSGAIPTLRVAVVEAEIAGFGASGRNGGWCSALFAGQPRRDRAGPRPRRRGRARSARCSRRSTRSAGCSTAEGIDAHFHKGGTLELATRPTARRRGCGPGSSRSDGGASATTTCAGSTPAEASARDRAPPACSAGCTRRTAPGCTRPGSCAVSPTRSSGSGATIYEQSRVVDLAPGHRRHRRRPGAAPSAWCSPPRATPRALPGRAPHARAALLADDRDRAAARRGSGTRSAGPGARRSPTAATSSSTRSAPPTTASRSVAAARRTTSAAGSATTSTATARVFAELRVGAHRAVPRGRRRAHHPRVGRSARRPARLVLVGRLRPRDRRRLGRRLRRRRREHHQPRRAHARRPPPRHRLRPHRAAVGQPPVAARGSRSRCAGSASTPACASRPAPTAHEARTGRPSRWRERLLAKLVG